jgi:hypothetical protein
VISDIHLVHKRGGKSGEFNFSEKLEESINNSKC